jgi:hypothetical protein
LNNPLSREVFHKMNRPGKRQRPLEGSSTPLYQPSYPTSSASSSHYPRESDSFLKFIASKRIIFGGRWNTVSWLDLELESDRVFSTPQLVWVKMIERQGQEFDFPQLKVQCETLPCSMTDPNKELDEAYNSRLPYGCGPIIEYVYAHVTGKIFEKIMNSEEIPKTINLVGLSQIPMIQNTSESNDLSEFFGNYSFSFGFSFDHDEEMTAFLERHHDVKITVLTRVYDAINNLKHRRLWSSKLLTKILKLTTALIQLYGWNSFCPEPPHPSLAKMIYRFQGGVFHSSFYEEIKNNYLVRFHEGVPDRFQCLFRTDTLGYDERYENDPFKLPQFQSCIQDVVDDEANMASSSDGERITFGDTLRVVAQITADLETTLNKNEAALFPQLLNPKTYQQLIALEILTKPITDSSIYPPDFIAFRTDFLKLLGISLNPSADISPTDLLIEKGKDVRIINGESENIRIEDISLDLIQRMKETLRPDLIPLEFNVDHAQIWRKAGTYQTNFDICKSFLIPKNGLRSVLSANDRIKAPISSLARFSCRFKDKEKSEGNIEAFRIRIGYFRGNTIVPALVMVDHFLRREDDPHRFRGSVLIVGEPGCGKTSLLRAFVAIQGPLLDEIVYKTQYEGKYTVEQLKVIFGSLKFLPSPVLFDTVGELSGAGTQGHWLEQNITKVTGGEPKEINHKLDLIIANEFPRMITIDEAAEKVRDHIFEKKLLSKIDGMFVSVHGGQRWSAICRNFTSFFGNLKAGGEITTEVANVACRSRGLDTIPANISQFKSSDNFIPDENITMVVFPERATYRIVLNPGIWVQIFFNDPERCVIPVIEIKYRLQKLSISRYWNLASEHISQRFHSAHPLFLEQGLDYHHRVIEKAQWYPFDDLFINQIRSGETKFVPSHRFFQSTGVHKVDLSPQRRNRHREEAQPLSSSSSSSSSTQHAESSDSASIDDSLNQN